MVDDREEEEHWKRVDLYFYDYQTTSANILIQSSRLRNFIENTFPKPNVDPFLHPVVASALGRNDTLLQLTSGYDALFLVGHSLGGVIIRQMVVELASILQGQMKQLAFAQAQAKAASGGADIALEAHLRPVLASSVRLFAPGLFGFEPTNLAGFIYHFAKAIPMLNHFLRVAASSNAVFKELAMGSSRLAELRRRTEDIARTEEWRALRANMLFGSDEEIVYMERYDCDPEIGIVESRDHTSVCKPTPAYRTPLEFAYGRTSSARA